MSQDRTSKSPRPSSSFLLAGLLVGLLLAGTATASALGREESSKPSAEDSVKPAPVSVASPAPAAAPAAPLFAVETVRDPGTGWTLVKLTSTDPADPRRSLEATVVPEAGSNLASLKVGGTELLRQPARLADLAGFGYGTPVLYPTPNRIRAGVFTYGGETFRFNDPGREGNFIHGLVGREAWRLDGPAVAAKDHAEVRTVLEVGPGHPVYRKFPFRHRITLSFRLEATGIGIVYAVTNLEETRPLPFGFALHPYFNFLGDRTKTVISVPADKRMEATPDLLPTGKLLDVAGTRFDLRKPVSPASVVLDDVYFGLRPEAPAGFAVPELGLEVALEASTEFRHMVIYTPKDAPFFCMENQTSSTDAHNLHAKGLTEEAHLLVAVPGKESTGRVFFRIRRK